MPFGLLLQPDLPLMFFADLLGDGEVKASALDGVAGGISAVKLVEGMAFVLDRHYFWRVATLSIR